jgi:hypothetical protein
VCLGLAPDAWELAVCGSRSRCCNADCVAVSRMVLCKFKQHTRGWQRRRIRSTVDGSRSRGLVRATERAVQYAGDSGPVGSQGTSDRPCSDDVSQHHKLECLIGEQGAH